MGLISKALNKLLAIEALKNDIKISRRRTAQIYNVTKVALYVRMPGTCSKMNHRLVQQKLTKDEEGALSKYIIDMNE